MKLIVCFIGGMALCALLGGVFLILKTPMGWDVLSVGGYNSYLKCLEREVRLVTQGRNVEEQAKYDAQHGVQ